MRRAALVSFVVAVGAFVVLAVVPYANGKHLFPASITSPAPRHAVGLAELPAHSRLCMTRITIEPRSRVARFQVGTYGKPGQPLALTLSGPGYSDHAQIPAGYPDNQVHQIPVSPPARPTLVTVCMRDLGQRKLALYAAPGQERSRAGVTVDGRPVGVTPQFGFWEASPRSLASHPGLTVERMAAFRGPFGHTWIVWLVLALAAVSLVLGAGLLAWYAFGASSRFPTVRGR